MKLLRQKNYFEFLQVHEVACPNETQVKVIVVYPSGNVAIPTLHDKQSPLA
jgi:hypothetical protein